MSKLHIFTSLCEFMARISKYQHLNNQYLMVKQLTQQWYIQKSKIHHVEHLRSNLWTDSWSNKWMPGTLKPFMNVSKKAVLNVWWPTAPIKCIRLPIKLTHNVAFGPAFLKLNQKLGNYCSFIMKIYFLKSTQMVLELWQSNICQKMTKIGPRICLRYLVSKFHKNSKRKRVLDL